MYQSIHCFYSHFSYTSLETIMEKAVQPLLQTADTSKVYFCKCTDIRHLYTRINVSPRVC